MGPVEDAGAETVGGAAKCVDVLDLIEGGAELFAVGEDGVLIAGDHHHGARRQKREPMMKIQGRLLDLFFVEAQARDKRGEAPPAVGIGIFAQEV